MLLIVTPDSGTKVVIPDPISIRLYLDPTGMATDEFTGIVRFIVVDVDKRIVFDTSGRDRVKFVVFVTTSVWAASISEISSIWF